MFLKLTFLLSSFFCSIILAQTSHTFSVHNTSLKLEPVVSDLNVPWSFVFLPSGDMLITERKGRLLWYKKGSPTNQVSVVKGLMPVQPYGQGGLMDVVLHPQFKKNKLLYFTYSVRSKAGYTTRVSKGQWNKGSLSQVEVLYTAQPYYKTGYHFGSRLVFDKKGYIFFSVGDRGNRDLAQSLNTDNGKIFRLHEDGSIPKDNPFGSSIWSYGHRNIQGMVYVNGELWTHEHGPRGGDEINLIQKGKNYGWPIITYGEEYAGGKIGEGTFKKGWLNPKKYYTPSIAPSGMAYLSRSSIYPFWQNSFFIGSLVLIHLNRVSKDFKTEERILQNIGRVRDVRVGPDGLIYLSVDNKGIFRIVPQK